jgi:hypothetical protein
MRGLKYLILAAFAVVLFSLPVPKVQAQVSFGIDIGAQPACPYGYYDYSPYNCAPYGYYGSQWFNSGVFIGAGPWFHGPRGFYGPVNHRYDPHYGYHGRYPEHGGYHQPQDNFHSFHGTFMRDGHGHEQPMGHGGDHGHR